MSDQQIDPSPVSTSAASEPSSAPEVPSGAIVPDHSAAPSHSTPVDPSGALIDEVDGDPASLAPTDAQVPPPAPALTRPQVIALEELADGASVTDAANIAGVSRATLYRWLTRNPAVRAAYNRWKAACDESTRSRLKALQDLAVDVVSEELETKRNGRIAAMLLDKMGFLAATPPGAPDSRRAQIEIDLENRQRNLELGQRSHQIAFDNRCVGSDHRIEAEKR